MGLGAAGALGALVQHESIKDLEDDTKAICAAVSVYYFDVIIKERISRIGIIFRNT